MNRHADPWILGTLWVAIQALTTSAAYPQVVRWSEENGGNGHLYEVVAAPGGTTMVWAEAFEAAKARLGDWHLVTITSQAENDFVYSLFKDKPEFFSTVYFNVGPWIGAVGSGNCSPFAWTTGEPFIYSAWGPREPFCNGDRVAFFGYQPQATAPDRWDDIPGSAPLRGYVIESGGTTVCGDIGLAQPELWQVDKSPYLIGCDVRVHDLEIEPGVEIYAAGDYVFEVAGTLRAVGTQERFIRFGNTKDQPWKGIFFRSSDSACVLEFCEVTGSTMSGIRIDSAKPSISNCKIFGNSAVRSSCWMARDPHVPYHGGGGIQSNSDLLLESCDISDNQSLAPPDTPGPCGIDNDHLLDGGAVSTAGFLCLVGCSFQRNVVVCTAGGAGGAIFAARGLRMHNCLIMDNSIQIHGWVSRTVRGGGIAVDGGGTELSNCLVARNSASAYAVVEAPHAEGCGIFLSGGTATITNCTIVSNEGNVDQAGVASRAELSIRNSIAYHNAGSQLSGTVFAEYCIIEGGFDGVGVFDLSPGFVNGSPLFKLAPGSPCIDAGDPRPEYFDCPGGGARGGPRNDIGYQGGPCQFPCQPAFRRGDANGDRSVDISDAILLLGFLFSGESAPGCLDAADVDDNGVLEITDPIALLGFSFLGRNPPPAPGPTSCGRDPTQDRLPDCQDACS